MTPTMTNIWDDEAKACWEAWYAKFVEAGVATVKNLADEFKRAGLLPDSE